MFIALVAGTNRLIVMLPLGKKANALAATTLKNSMAELINDAQEENEQDSMMANGDEDDEGREWEEAQIKRGEGRVYIQVSRGF